MDPLGPARHQFQDPLDLNVDLAGWSPIDERWKMGSFSFCFCVDRRIGTRSLI